MSIDGQTAGGNTSWDAFVTKYDGSDGTKLWTQQLGTATTSTEHAFGVATGSDNNVYITGHDKLVI